MRVSTAFYDQSVARSPTRPKMRFTRWQRDRIHRSGNARNGISYHRVESRNAGIVSNHDWTFVIRFMPPLGRCHTH